MTAIEKARPVQLKSVSSVERSVSDEEIPSDGADLSEDLAEAIERQASPLPLLFDLESTEEKQQRIEKMFDCIASAASKLTPELCKEEHGEFMRLRAQVEQLCLCVEARLISLEDLIQSREIPTVTFLMETLTPFSEKARKMVRARSEAIRRRDHGITVINRWKELVRTQRKRPDEIHEAAVKHVKQLLLHDDPRYRHLQDEVQATSAALRGEEGKGYTNRREALKEALQALQAQLPRIEAEASDRALQQVQESDNGPRQK